MTTMAILVAATGAYAATNIDSHENKKAPPALSALSENYDTARQGFIEAAQSLKINNSRVIINSTPKGDMVAVDAYHREVETLKEVLFPQNECDGVCGVQESEDRDFLTTGDITQWIAQGVSKGHFVIHPNPRVPKAGRTEGQAYRDLTVKYIDFDRM